MLLQVKNLNIFHKNLLIIDNINFKIESGEIFSIVGESGSGKTITGLSIINLLPQDFRISGQVIFNQRDILSMNKAELRKLRGRHISYIFQDSMTSLNPVLKVGHQVAEMLVCHYRISKKEAIEKTKDLFNKLKILHTINSYPHQLSGGMRQRVMIAMAVACEPELIIADEPTTALDVTVQEEILDILYLLVKQEQKSWLLITHDINILGEYADRVMVLYAGRIMEMAQTDEIFKNPLHPYTKALLNCLPREGKQIYGIPGNIPDFKNLPKGCVFHPRCSYKMNQCLNQSPSVNQVTSGHFVSCWLY